VEAEEGFAPEEGGYAVEEEGYVAAEEYDPEEAA
jgi:hypothetical protein